VQDAQALWSAADDKALQAGWRPPACSPRSGRARRLDRRVHRDAGHAGGDRRLYLMISMSMRDCRRAAQ